MHNEFPADPQMRRNLNARVPRAQGALAQRTQRITGSAFRISFNLDWLMDNDIFNRVIMARTQTPWYTGGDPEHEFGAVSLTDLTRVRFRVVAVNSCFAIIVTKPSSIARRITSKVRFLNF